MGRAQIALPSFLLYVSNHAPRPHHRCTTRQLLPLALIAALHPARTSACYRSRSQCLLARRFLLPTRLTKRSSPLVHTGSTPHRRRPSVVAPTPNSTPHRHIAATDLPHRASLLPTASATWPVLPASPSRPTAATSRAAREHHRSRLGQPVTVARRESTAGTVRGLQC